MIQLVRWRSKNSWTKTHRVRVHSNDSLPPSDLTACDSLIPNINDERFASLGDAVQRDMTIPVDWPLCKRCFQENE
jgi:hypothetical protein